MGYRFILIFTQNFHRKAPKEGFQPGVCTFEISIKNNHFYDDSFVYGALALSLAIVRTIFNRLNDIISLIYYCK